MDIIANILNEAHDGAKKTHIMYKCNLSHKQLQVYLKLMLRIGFLELYSSNKNNERDLFKSTAKGLKFLKAYRELEALMDAPIH